ncbi:MAG TPA: hypothetical protein VIX42_12295 [Edaphobacter sp.]
MTASTLEQDRASPHSFLGRLSQPWLLALLFAIALLIQLVAIRRFIGTFDECLSLYGADRILHGGRPYRDFLTPYGPAQFYLLAFWSKIFGTSALVGRVYDACIRAGIACASFALVTLFASRRYAVLAFAAVILWLTCIDDMAYNYAAYPALLLSLISCLFFARYLNNPSRIWPLVGAGGLVGATVCFRHDIGFYLFLAQIATLFWSVSSTSRSGGTTTSTLPALYRPALCYIAGIAVIVLPVALLLLWFVPSSDLFFDLFYLPAKIYPRMRHLHFRTFAIPHLLRHPFSWDNRFELQETIVYFPILACIVSASVLFRSRHARSALFSDPPQRQIFGLLTILAALFFIKGLVRVSAMQMILCIVVGIILLVVLLSRIPRLDRVSAIIVSGVALVFLASSASITLGLIVFTSRNVRDLIPSRPNSFSRTCHPPAGLERARCLIVDPASEAAMEYVEQRTSPQDKIFVGAGRHDKITTNDIRFYFLTSRLAITKWQDFEPGVQTTLPVQNQIIASMQEYSPKFIVLNSAWDDMNEPNSSRFSSGVTALDDYIHAHYTPQATFGTISILAPKEQHQAAGSPSK